MLAVDLMVEADVIGDSIRDAMSQAFRENDDDGADNMFDAIANLASAAKSIANAMTPLGLAPGDDASGGAVGSLTEAVMGVTAGLVRIADSIEMLACAVSETGQK